MGTVERIITKRNGKVLILKKYNDVRRNMMEHSIIKEYLLHTQECVRKYAAEFFAEGNIQDSEVTELLLDCLERGVEQEEAWGILRYISILPQTENTLERINTISLSDYNSRHHIDNTIASADLALIKRLPHIRPKGKDARRKLDTRFSFSELKTEELWDKLWKHSNSGVGKTLGEFNYNYGEWIIEELCARKNFSYEKFMDKLKEEYPPEYRGWKDIYLCFMAGELTSIEAIPFLIGCIKIDGDFICEKACDALVQIGTDEVIDAIENEYLKEEFHFRIFAVGVLEKVKSEKSERLMLELFPKENDVSLKTALAYGLCKHFSKEGIPKILTLLRYGYDRMMVNLEEAIYVNHIINNLEHKDLEKWRSCILEDKNRMKEARKNLLEGNIDIEQMQEGMKRFMNNLESKNKLSTFYSTRKKKIGRNDPCPCGSGKKYKKCCLNRSN